MKSLKFVLVAAILSLAMVGYAGEKKKEQANKTVKITLNEAREIPILVNAMYQQLELCELKTVKPGYCCGWVECNAVVYQIYGPEQAWIRFFRDRPGKLVKTLKW